MSVNDFNGKTLSSVGSSTILIDARDIPEVAALRAWYEGGGSAGPVMALSSVGGGSRNDRRVTLAMIREEGLGLGGERVYVAVRVSVCAGAVCFCMSSQCACVGRGGVIVCHILTVSICLWRYVSVYVALRTFMCVFTVVHVCAPVAALVYVYWDHACTFPCCGKQTA